jgi:hypothetical protein
MLKGNLFVFCHKITNETTTTTNLSLHTINTTLTYEDKKLEKKKKLLYKRSITIMTSEAKSMNANAHLLQQQQQQQQQQNPGAAIAVAVNNATTPTTPPGFNSSRRYIARYILWLVVLTLMSGKYIPSGILSAMSIIILKEGTIFSGKNIKWMLLSIVSFLSSVTAFACFRGSQKIDEERAYTLYITFWLASKSIQIIWGIVLGLFLFSAATSKSSSSSSFDPTPAGTAATATPTTTTANTAATTTTSLAPSDKKID